MKYTVDPAMNVDPTLRPLLGIPGYPQFTTSAKRKACVLIYQIFRNNITIKYCVNLHIFRCAEIVLHLF